jgi:hypothetical protein
MDFCALLHQKVNRDRCAVSKIELLVYIYTWWYGHVVLPSSPNWKRLLHQWKTQQKASCVSYTKDDVGTIWKMPRAIAKRRTVLISLPRTLWPCNSSFMLLDFHSKLFIFSQRERENNNTSRSSGAKQIRSITLCQQNFNSDAFQMMWLKPEEGVWDPGVKRGDATYVSVCQSCGSDVTLWDQCSHGHRLTCVRHGVNGECNTCF